MFPAHKYRPTVAWRAIARRAWRPKQLGGLVMPGAEQNTNQNTFKRFPLLREHVIAGRLTRCRTTGDQRCASGLLIGAVLNST